MPGAAEWLANTLGVGALTPQQRAEKQRKKEERTSRVESGRFEVKFHNDLAIAKKELAHLKTLEGVEGRVTAIQFLIDEATEKGSRQKFKTACEADLSRVPAQIELAKKESAAHVKKTKADFRTAFQFKEQVDRLASDDAYLPPDVKAFILEQTASAVKPLFAAGATSAAHRPVLISLEAIRDSTRAKINVYRSKQAAANTTYVAAKAALAELVRVGASERETALFTRQAETIGVMLLNRDYDRASETGTALATGATALQPTVAARAAEWAGLRPRIGESFAKLKALDASPCPLLSTQAPTIAETKAELDRLKSLTPPRDLSHAEAVAALRRCIGQVIVNQERHAQFLAFAETREAADREVKAAIAAVEAEGRKLRAAAQRQAAEEGRRVDIATFGGCEKSLRSFEARWNRLYAAACDPEGIAEKSSILATLERLREQVVVRTSSKLACSTVGLENELEAARGPYEVSLKACEAAFATLAPLGVAESDYRLFQAKLAILTLAEGPEVVGIVHDKKAKLDALKIEIDRYRADFLGRIAAAQTGVTTVRTQATASLRRFLQRIEVYEQSWLKHVSDSGLYKKYVKIFVEEIAQFDGIETASDLEVLAAAVVDLGKIRKRCDEALEALEGRTPPDSLPTMEGLGAKITSFASFLENADLTEYASATRRVLATELEDIKKNLVKTPMDKTNDALVAWKKKVGEKIREAGGVKEEYQKFVADVATLKSSLISVTHDFEPLHVNYFKSLVKQLDQLLVSGKSEAGKANAKMELILLREEIHSAVTNPERMAAGQSAMEDLEEDAERNEAVWSELYKQFLATLKTVKALNPESALYDELVSLGSMANAAFTKTKDLENAKLQLKNANQRAAWVQKYPQGLEAAQAGELQAVRTKWKAALNAFREELDRIADAVGTVAGVGGEVLEANTRRKLDELADLFSVSAFDAVVTGMTSSNPGERASKREIGLGVVRRYRNYLLKDNRFKLLKANPFVAPLASLNLINNALADAEAKLLLTT